jgi:hypothetical protein
MCLCTHLAEIEILTEEAKKNYPRNLWFITNKKELVIYRNTNFQAATVWLLTRWVGLALSESEGASRCDGVHIYQHWIELASKFNPPSPYPAFKWRAGVSWAFAVEIYIHIHFVCKLKTFLTAAVAGSGAMSYHSWWVCVC